MPEDGLVEVHILVPHVYGHRVDEPGTRALRDLPVVPEELDLEEGATLWLTYEHQINPDDAATAENESEYSSPKLKSYVVKSSSGGYHALYACRHSLVDGKLVVDREDVVKAVTPLFLKHDSTYRFRMITPALPIDPSTLAMRVDNGDSFASTDQRYIQTEAKTVTIEAQANGVNYVSLNPMIHQTARLRFLLVKGANVSTIDMMGDGIEISGLQMPYGHERGGVSYQWSSMNEGDTLVMRKGDKRAWVTLNGASFTEDASGNLSGEICVLPTDARSSIVTILLNMSVNGVPTQYITTLTGMVFEHAKSYNMRFVVSLKNDIVVVNWQNISWTEDL